MKNENKQLRVKKTVSSWCDRSGTTYTAEKGKKRVVWHHWHDTNQVAWRLLSGDGRNGTLFCHESGEWLEDLDSTSMQAFALAKLGGN